MKVKLYLHGHLKDKVQKDFVEVEATTLIDALRNFEMRYRKVLKAPMDIGRWKIRVKDFENKESWEVPLFVDEVHIYPEFRMGKSQSTSTWVQIGIGAALVASVVFAGPLGLTALMGTALGSSSITVGSIAFSMGLGLAMSGLLNLLFPQPTAEGLDSTNSKYLGAGQNTTKSGTRIPFGYGTFKLAGQIISYNTSSNVLKVYEG